MGLLSGKPGAIRWTGGQSCRRQQADQHEDTDKEADNHGQIDACKHEGTNGQADNHGKPLGERQPWANHHTVGKH